LEKGAELRGAVMHVGRSHGELSGWEERRWAGSKKASLANHDFLVLDWI